jgi:hypothetical protein
MRTIRTLTVALLALLAGASLAGADTWTEIGDAGDNLATAQSTGLPGHPLTDIFGRIDNVRDVDMYMIFIPGGNASFSATTVGTPGTLNDTQLFLFDVQGHGVYANDDANATTRRSTLPANNALTPQTAGIYFIAIAPFGRVPVDAMGNLIFNSFPQTGVFGPNNPAATLAGWVGAAPPNETGTYDIRLTGTQTAPEPGTLALTGLGVLSLAGYGWLRRRSA